jgi:hypothetical protein
VSASYQGGGGGINPTAAYYQARALSLLGLAAVDKNFLFDFDDFDKAHLTTDQTGWQKAVVGTGTLSTRVSGTRGGVHLASTGATTGGVTDVQNLSVIVSDLSADKWYMAWRQKMTTTVAAATRAHSGFLNIAATRTIQVGVFGASSTVNFRLQYDGMAAGSFLDLGVAIDQSYHVFEVYGKGEGNNKIYVRTDEGAELSVTAASNPTDGMFLWGEVINGADNVNYAIQRDFCAWLSPR